MAASGSVEVERTLWVHFDVNKTLIAIDPASGQDLDTALEGALANSAWGVVTRTSSSPMGSFLASFPLIECPDGVSRPVPDAKEFGFEFLAGESVVSETRPEVGSSRVLTLMEFLEDIAMPYVEETLAAERGWDVGAVRKANHEIKVARRAVVSALFAPSGPASPLAFHLEGMKKALAVSLERVEAVAASGLPHVEGGRFRFLAPAYFHFLEWLARNRPNSCVVFRTFGTDLPEVIAEHNAFCRGEHPLYPSTLRLDGSPFAIGGSHEGKDPSEGISGEGGVNFLCHMPECTGAISRYGSGRHGTALATVVLEHDSVGPVTLIRGTDAIHEELSARRARGWRTFGIQDDYPWWKKHDEVGEAGKVLLVHDSPEGLRHELSVFFDDNVGYNRPKIVDARDYLSGEALEWERSRGIHLRKVALPFVLEHPDYFVRGLLDAERLAKARMAE
jgi:hypothetical protein